MPASRFTLIPSGLRDGARELANPLADWLVRGGVRPNAITAAGVVLLFVSGALFGTGHPRGGAALLLVSGLLDMLDGQVARRGGTASRFGAFFDSTLDRLGEAALFSGIAIYFVTTAGQRWPILGLGVSLITLAGAFLVSYSRARAEGLGMDCEIGIAQRPERILGLGVPTLLVGAGPKGWLLLGLMTVLAVVNAITVVQRILHVHRLATAAPAAAAPVSARATGPAVAEPVAKGT